jgi:hypothetical protein
MTCCSPADTDDKIFDDIFRDYVLAFNENKYDEFLKFIPSQTFEKFSKDYVIEQYEIVQKTIGQTRIEDYEFIKRGQVLTKGDSTFRKIKYKSTIVNYSNRDTVNLSAVKYLANIYGEENIEYDSLKHLYIIHQVKDLIFMRSKDTNWTFLEYDSNKKNKLTKRLVPADILERL